MLTTCAAAIAALLLTVAKGPTKSSSFNYVPRVTFTYAKNSPLPVFVNSMHSHETLVSLDYYSLPFCSPKSITVENLNYGQILMGSKIQKSPYSLPLLKDVSCQETCATKEILLDAKKLKRFKQRINNGYRVNFVTDNLPVINPSRYLLGKATMDCYDRHPRGFPLGTPKKCHGSNTLIHNHIVFNVTVNKESEESDNYIIITVKIIPFSIDWEVMDKQCDSNFDPFTAKLTPLTTELGPNQQNKRVRWTYGVIWNVSQNMDWFNRWNEYILLSFSNSSTTTHWASIINAFLIVLLLAVIVALILLRTLHIDFNRYNSAESEDEAIEEMGWKLVHGDVFRTPAWPGLFSVFIGTGVQLIGVFCLSMSLALYGVVSPNNRGALLSVAIFEFVMMSLANGFVTGVMLNMFHKRQWKIVFLSATLYPGFLFCVWLMTELYISMTRVGATTASVWTILEVMGLWFGLSVPLVVLGAGFGFRMPRIEPVTRVSKLPRKVPPQRWYLETPILCVAPGILPFGAAFVELRYILFSLWQGLVYYMFSFLVMTALTVVLASAEVAVVAIYFLLVFEEHRWWWRSIAIPGGMGIWFFIYSIYYYNQYLQLNTSLAVFIYFTTMAVVSFSLFIVVGTIGFIACFFFIRTIYTTKID